MLDRHEAEKAIKAGVSRWGCKLVSCEFDENDVTITVRGTNPMLQVGREYRYWNETANQLALRVSRFCMHYANNKNFKFKWGESLV